MSQNLSPLFFLLAATASSGCSLDATGVSTGAIIEVDCASDAECPAGFECEIEEEHGVTTSFCKSHDGSDECPAGFEVEEEHGQVFCQPHGGDDGASGDDVVGNECAVDADCPSGLECEHGVCAAHGGDEAGDDNGGQGAEPGDDNGGQGAEPGDDNGGAGDDAPDTDEDVQGAECAVDAECGAGLECEHGFCVPDVGHGGGEDDAR